VVVAFRTIAGVRPDAATTLFVAVAIMLVVTMAAAVRPRRDSFRPMAEGKVVVVVPAYNENPDTLRASIQSLLDQTRLPDAIVVVDDGSKTPVVPFPHPLITWTRQENAGKRHAQIAGLAGHEDADFILTVDSDSVVHPDALEQLLRTMSCPEVQAVTGHGVVRNWSKNLTTRLVDLEFVVGNLTARRLRSSAGVVAPCSGPLSLYRASLLFDNIDDYLTSGTYGDDRRLTHYALMRGKVVANDAAVVEMDMPDTWRKVYRQRVRWFKGYAKYLPWELRNLNGPALWLRVWNLVLSVLFPIIFIWALIVHPIVTGGVYWQAWVYWTALLYGITAHYLVDRPVMPLPNRVMAWLLLTPILIVIQLLVLRPALLVGWASVRDDRWVTRD
jgi:hyaluronan synthase